MRSVAFIGKAGTGKTTLSQMLSEHHGYEVLSIAAPIREVARMAYGKFSKEMRYPQQTLGLSRLISGRELLQEIGAALRDMDSLFRMRIWLRRTRTDGSEFDLPTGEPWAVDDVRLDAERAFILAWYPDTLFVRLVRPEAGELQPWQRDITERQAGDMEAELVLDTQALSPSECIAAVLEAAHLEVQA
jgi:hypothetical protein